MEAQQKALAEASFWKVLAIVSVPVTAFFLTLGVEGVLYLRWRLVRRRLLDYEVTSK